MRLALVACVALSLAGCRALTEFQVDKPSKVADIPPPSPDAPGRSHTPYTGKPKYLASAGPMLPTSNRPPAGFNPCAVRSQPCEEQLRALLLSLDGQILGLSTPVTDLQLSALVAQARQLAPLLVPYQDMASEGDELLTVVARLPSMTSIDQRSARRRLIELADLIRVQLAAAQ
jgi:hypothetical protein